MLDGKYKKLRGIIRDNRRVLVAFSGGVDSSLLARVAWDVLGGDAIAVTVDSEVMAAGELKGAERIAREIGIEHLVVNIDFMKDKKFMENSPLRCYYCKKKIMKLLRGIAQRRGFDAILDGSNTDDLIEERAGLRALRGEGIPSPLADAGFGKGDVRKLAGELGLSNALKESGTCLATRIPYGDAITRDKLKRVERAEEFIKKFRVRNLRVRDLDGVARIEVSDESIPAILNNKEEIEKKLKLLGYVQVTVDM